MAWKKSLVVVDMSPSGEIRETFHVRMSQTEETPSVEEVPRLLKEQLGFEVIFLDANTSLASEPQTYFQSLLLFLRKITIIFSEEEK